jgi:hypothetical protein
MLVAVVALFGCLVIRLFFTFLAAFASYLASCIILLSLGSLSMAAFIAAHNLESCGANMTNVM